MKKIICLLLTVCILLCTTACQREAERPQGSESTEPTESQESTISTENKQGEEADQMRILTLEKALHTYYEWADDYDRALVRSEHAYVTMGQADADAYPASKH